MTEQHELENLKRRVAELEQHVKELTKTIAQMKVTMKLAGVRPPLKRR